MHEVFVYSVDEEGAQFQPVPWRAFKNEAI
jgi:hypothetical protein